VSGVKEDRSVARISLSVADAEQRRNIIALGLIALPQRPWNAVWVVELSVISDETPFGRVSMIRLGAVASVGMLATETERFGSGEEEDEGSSGVPEPISQRKPSLVGGVNTQTICVQGTNLNDMEPIIGSDCPAALRTSDGTLARGSQPEQCLVLARTATFGPNRLIRLSIRFADRSKSRPPSVQRDGPSQHHLRRTSAAFTPLQLKRAAAVREFQRFSHPDAEAG